MEDLIGEFLDIASLSKLRCCVHKGSVMVSLKHFHDFLKQQHDPNCGRDFPRKFNIKKELEKHHDSVKLNGEIIFSIPALLRYVFHHSNEYTICKNIVRDVISSLSLPGQSSNIKDFEKSRQSPLTSVYSCPDISSGQTSSNNDQQFEDSKHFTLYDGNTCPGESSGFYGDGRKTVMKKKNKPRKITQDDIPDEDSFDCLNDLDDEDEFYSDSLVLQNHSQNGNKTEELLRNDIEKFSNGEYSDDQPTSSNKTSLSEDISNEADEIQDKIRHFHSITDSVDDDEFPGKINYDQEYQYVLETGEVPRDEYDAYDQLGESCLTCNLCSKRFSTPGNLKTHVRTHTGEKPYYCQFCNKRFTTKGNLDVHVRTHTGERPYKCHHCDKYFSTIGNRQVHMRTHTQERPFTCNLCHKPFSTKANLHTHMRTHSGRRDHECSFCGKAYTTLANLQTHMRSHNPFIQSFLPTESAGSPTNETEQAPVNLGINNLLQSQNLLGSMNMNLFNPALFLPMTIPLGMNTFIPPNLLANGSNPACLNLSGRDEKKAESSQSQSSTAAGPSTLTEPKKDTTQKRPIDQEDTFRAKSLKSSDNSTDMPNGFFPNMAFLNHMNLMNTFPFSVPSQNNL